MSTGTAWASQCYGSQAAAAAAFCADWAASVGGGAQCAVMVSTVSTTVGGDVVMGFRTRAGTAGGVTLVSGTQQLFACESAEWVRSSQLHDAMPVVAAAVLAVWAGGMAWRAILSI